MRDPRGVVAWSLALKTFVLLITMTSSGRIKRVKSFTVACDIVREFFCTIISFARSLGDKGACAMRSAGSV